MSGSPSSAGPDVEVAIVGAGVIGLAVAAVLSESRSVAIIERHEGYGRETSSHNSGVVHAGIYHPRDWLKTALCIEGNRLLYAWAQDHGIRARRTAKLIVATEEAQVPALEALFQSSSANGVPDLRLIDGRELRALEPAVRGVAAIYSGSSGVVDQMGLMRSFLDVARRNGAHVAFKHTATSVQRANGGFEAHAVAPDGREIALTAAALVNCAGLLAAAIGESLGYDPDGGPANPAFRQTINKGRYYDLVNRDKAKRYSHLVYPLPHDDRAGLGVHLTLDIDGGVHLGPDTEWLEEGAPLDYRASDDRRAEFIEAARPYLPDLEPEDLAVGQVGYRPKLSGPSEPPRDFLIWHDRSYVHLGGIESPGLTASLAIARQVAALLP
jgi:L-2-hydroxyglutarate oxidase LhgO